MWYMLLQLSFGLLRALFTFGYLVFIFLQCWILADNFNFSVLQSFQL